MRRVAAAVLLAIALTACTSDEDPNAIESPSASESVSPSPSASATPTPSASPDDDASPSESPSASPDPSASPASPDPSASPTVPASPTASPEAPAPQPKRDPVTPTAGTTVTYDAAGTPFAASTAPSRRYSGDDPTKGNCPITKTEGENVTSCTLAYSRTSANATTAGGWFVAYETEAGGERSTTIYKQNGTSFDAALTAGPYPPGTYTFKRISWPNHADLLLVTVANQGTDVIAWNGGDAPRVAGRFTASAGGTRTYVAQRILQTKEDGGHVVEVLEIPTSGPIRGTRTKVASGEHTAEEVALKLHHEWVTGDRAGAGAYATDEVVDKLWKGGAPDADVYALNGLSCPTQADHFRCDWTASGATMTWEVISTDGKLVVGKLESRET